MAEIWKDVLGFEGLYQVSDLGRIRNARTGKIRVLSVQKLRGGYLQVGLSKDGRRKYLRVHRVVWEAFNGPIPAGMHINHINENKTDNRLKNLNLMTPKENNIYGTRMQRVVEKKSETKRVEQYTKDGVFIQVWQSPKEVEDVLGYNRSNIASCCRGYEHFNTAYGFVWKYANNA